MSLFISGAGIFGTAILFILGGLLVLLLPVFAIVDLLKSKMRDNEKVLWIIVIIIIPIAGSLIYFLAGRKN